MVAPLAACQPRVLLAAVVLSALALCPVISPTADAAVGRASEYAADRYAAQIGYEQVLALALRTTHGDRVSQPRPPVLRDHPSIDRRLRRLEAAAGRAP